MRDFQEVVQQVQAFVQSVLEQNWFAKLVSWRSTAADISSMEVQLNKVYKALGFGAELKMLTVISSIEAEGKKVEALIKDAGGIDKLIGSPEKLKDFIGG